MQNYQRANSRGNQGHRRRRGTGTYRNEQVSLNSNAYRMRATAAAAGTSRQNATANSQPDRETGWERLRPWVITIGVTSLVTATTLFASGVKLSPPFDILPTALLIFLLILMALLLILGMLSIYHWHADRQLKRNINSYYDDEEDDTQYLEADASATTNRATNNSRQNGQSPQQLQSGKTVAQPGTDRAVPTPTIGNIGGLNFIIDPNQRPTQLLMVNPDLDPQITTWEAIEQQYQIHQQQLLSENARAGNGQMLPGVRGPQRQNYYRQQQEEV